MDVTIQARGIAARLAEEPLDVEPFVDALLRLRALADAGPADLRGFRRCAIAEALGHAASRSERARAALTADLDDSDGFGEGETRVALAAIAAEALTRGSPSP